jgi:hypothetical protein
MNDEHDLGYLKAKVQGLEERVSSHIAWEEEYHKSFEEKLDKISNSLTEHLSFYRFLKAAVYTLAFIAAFKFGDISDLWSNRN